MSSRLRNLNPYELHKYLVNVYCLNKKGSTGLLKRDTSRDRTDLDIIRENYKFLWEEDDVADTWEKQLAKKYYDKLFKEYCICDLSRYKENKVALRWRIEKEVVLGKGQFQCGNKVCNCDRDLKSWEVNFAYIEDDEKKNALVKLLVDYAVSYSNKCMKIIKLPGPSFWTVGYIRPQRLCPECSEKLNYKSKKREIKRLKKSQKKNKKGKIQEKDVEEGGIASDIEHSPKTPQLPAEPSTSTENVAESNDQSLWKQGVPEAEEKSREEEFEEYLDDLLL